MVACGTKRPEAKVGTVQLRDTVLPAAAPQVAVVDFSLTSKTPLPLKSIHPATTPAPEQVTLGIVNVVPGTGEATFA